MPVVTDDSDEVEFIQKQLKECKIFVAKEVVQLFIGLHFKFLNSVGNAPLDSKFEALLKDLKKKK